MISFFRRIALFLLLVGVSVTLFAQQTVTVKVLSTSDVHGALFPFDFINNRPTDHSLAQVYTYVKQERANANQSLVLLDNGDILQGQPAVYYSNFIDTVNQNIVPSILNFMGYNAASVGNHDIEAGPTVYNKVRAQYSFPWLGANIVNEETGKPWFKPYTIEERQGIRIAVLGLTTPGIPNWLPKNLWAGMQFTDMIESARYWVEVIKKEEKPHVIIGLFHSGHNPYYGDQSPEKPLNENASVLVAQQVPGFDVIFIGHDHDRMNKKFANVAGDSVLVLDPMSAAKLIAEAKITVSLDAKGNMIGKRVAGKLVETRSFVPDAEFVSTFADFYNRVNEFVDRPIGRFNTSATTRDAYFGSSAFVDLIHNVQMAVSGADISFAAPLSFDVTIPTGMVYVRDMFKLYKYENLLYTMKLTGKEIKDYLEFSYSLWLNTMSSPKDNLILFKYKPNGELLLQRDNRASLLNSYYGFDSAAGINYTVDVSKPVGERISIKSMADGSAFDLNKLYVVALNSYRGNGGGGHLFAKGAGLTPEQVTERLIGSTELDLRYYLMKWIEVREVINPKPLNNWSIVPSNWVEEAKKRDYQYMFGSSEFNLE